MSDTALEFTRKLENHARMVQSQFDALVHNVGEHVGQSILYGSPVTGAPGQPVKTGALLASWRKDKRGKYWIRWYSRLHYAPIIEDNFRGATLRSKVGGFHSVKMTANAFNRIVQYEFNLIQTTTFDPNAGRLRDTATGRFRARYG